MPRPRHPNQHIERAVQYAEQMGWTWRKSNGHAWGRLLCPHHERGGCQISVWSTPRTPENFARKLRREVDLCLIYNQVPNRMKPRKLPHAARPREHEFTLVLAVDVELTEQVEDSLFESGCDDAIVAVRCGRVCLTFTRSAPQLKDAVLSAITDVKRARVGEVVRVDQCDLVSQADIARRIRRTRQAVNHYISGQRGPGGFPPPACNISEEAPLWSWCEVATWLWTNDMLPEEDVREAEQALAINVVLDMKALKHDLPELVEEIETAV